MLITAKFTKLSCFVNTVLQLIFRKTSDLMSLTTFHRQCANHMQGVRLLTSFLPCLILMRSPDVADQGHLTPFSTGQLMAYKIKF